MNSPVFCAIFINTSLKKTTAELSLDQMLALTMAWNRSMSHETSSHEISMSLEIARAGVEMVISI